MAASYSMATPFSVHLVFLVCLSIAASTSSASSSSAARPRLIKFYVQQENEFATFPVGAADPRPEPPPRSSSNINATNASNSSSNGGGRDVGVYRAGASLAYEYPMTRNASPTSEVVGYVRGTAVVVSNAAGNSSSSANASSTLFFVSNVVHFSEGEWEGSTISQQGEAVISAQAPWELAIVGGTSDFRHAFGYNVGRLVAVSRTARNTTRLTTRYHAHLSYSKPT